MDRLQVFELNNKGPGIKNPRQLPHPVAEPKSIGRFEPVHQADQVPPFNESDPKKSQPSPSSVVPIVFEE